MKTNKPRLPALALASALALATNAPAEEHEPTLTAADVTPELITMHTKYYIHSFDTFADILGENMLAAPLLMFSVFTPTEQQRQKGGKATA